MGSRRGSALLEAVVALGILAVVAVPLMGMFGASAGGIRQSYDQLIGTMVAGSAMEEVLSQNWSVIPGEVGGQDPVFPSYQRQVTVTEPLPGLKEVTVTVTWPQGSGTGRVSLLTRVARR